MKSIVVIVLALIGLTSFNSFANDKEVIKSTISDVTVYMNGAQVYRKANFSVKAGITELIIEGVSPNIDPRSLQVKAFGNIILIDSKYDTYYPQPKTTKLEGLPLKIQNQIRALLDSIEDVSYIQKELQDEIDVLNNSKSILANNGAIRGQGKVNDSINLLKQALDYYQVKMNDINKKLQSIGKKKRSKDVQLSEMNARLNDLRNYQDSNKEPEIKGPIHRLILTVQSKEATSGKMNVSYLVSGASWVPTYDLRADILTGNVNLNFKANITQNCGESWENIGLTLSTNDPQANKTKPELHTWYLDYYNIGYQQGGYGRTNSLNSYNNVAPSAPAMKVEADNSNYEYKEAETANNFTTMINRVLSAEYKIDLPYTILSDGEEHMVLVKNIDLNAKYRYYCVPKLDASVFLVAEILKLDELKLVPATANIFFDGTYMGETYIDPTNMSDTLKLSLGKDPNIIVKRMLLKKESKEKILDKDKERTESFEIIAKNLKSTAIELVIEDQIPVTTNAEIVIEALETDKAQYNKNSGKLTWVTTLKPKEQATYKFSFKVKHPKDKNLIIQ